MAEHCELCRTSGGTILWEGPQCRVVRIADDNYPGYCRVIWQAHVREMTDLPTADRRAVMDIVFATESVVRELFTPHKVNLASFGNMTPHLHWHVIPRWQDDPHFPEPVWGRVQRTTDTARPPIDDQTLRHALSAKLAEISVETSAP